MKNYRYPLLLLIALVNLLFGCASDNQSSSNQIICTTTIVTDIVQHIKPPGIGLMGPGIDPHLYKSRSGDHLLMNNAKIIVYSGLHLEGKMTNALENLAKSKPVINLSEGISQNNLIQAEDFGGSYDPHFWFDIELFKQATIHCSEQLQKHFPSNKKAIVSRTTKYLHTLDSANREIHEMIRSLPVNQRVMITAHDAFSYFGKAHQFQVKGIQGASTAAEAGLKDITNLVNYIIENKVPSIFVESSVSERNVKAIIEGCKNKGHKLKLGGTLYSDALGNKTTGAETYVKMMLHNTQVIVNALKEQSTE